MPVLDMSVTALVNDLKDRGLEDDVLVVVLGEFGRTPKISPLAPAASIGRTPAARCSSAVA